ncbi:MAG: trehalose-6-phosphate synthase, partial [Gaiellaceae bacterium]
MPDRRRLIVVSNRGPVTFARVSDERVARRGGGGLVTGLRSLVEHHDVTWIASAMSDEDRAVAAESGGDAVEERSRDGSPFRLRLVAHDETAYDWFYNVVANPMLWFLQHYLWQLAYTPSVDIALSNAWDEGYARVNEGFAEAVLEELEAQPEAAVFFHDYHLYLAPRLVRERAPDALLAHFVHVPWPQTDYWHVLPDRIRRAVHEGVLANDVIGFHTHQWRLNFMRAASDLAGAEANFQDSVVDHDDRRSLVTVHPISVDAAEFDELALSDPVLVAEQELVARRSEQLVLRVDRTDPSKNIVRGFRAFGQLLDDYPELRGRVTFLASLMPSRQDVPEYADYLGLVGSVVAEVNARHHLEGWQPIDMRLQEDMAFAVAAYQLADVLVVNAVNDGMNLVAKEAVLVNQRDGVLLLSETTGAHEELGEHAITVHPFDVKQQADAMHEALTLEVASRRRLLAGAS